MIPYQSRKFGVVRRFAAGVLLGGSAIAATGCSLIPTTDDIRSATTTVKDTVTGKARKDKLNKTYAEARILERRKDFTAAERLYRELLVAEPKSRDCYHRLGVMAAVQGKYADAHQHYQAALACSAPTPDLLSDIGYCYYLQQQLPQAEQALRAAIAQQPLHTAALNNLAMVVGEQGNLDEAYDLFRKGNGEAEAESNFAYLCAQCGDLPNAQAHFSRALSVNPDMRPAAEALLQVTQAMQRRQDEARAQLAEAAAKGNAVQQASAQQPLAPQQPGADQAVGAAPVGAPSGVVLAGGYAQAAAAQNSTVQLASNNPNAAGAAQAANTLAAMPRQRLIEVYRGSPRTAAGNEQLAQASAAGSPQAPQPASAAAANPAGNQFPTAAGWSNGLPNTSMPQATAPNSVALNPTPTPFSYPSMPSPAHLQPSATSLLPESNGAQPNGAQGQGVAPASYNAPVRNVSAPNAGGRPAGLSFPSFGG
ncbi:MAG: tetratricopeptide repeat protein [Planctomycetia bacterium]|nr:tetratricopeptide repeat protein [Planctomycetia bacterium]